VTISRWRALGLALASCGLLFATSGTLAQAAARRTPSGGTLTIAMWSEPDNLNPWEYPTQYDQYVEYMAFDGLVRPSGNLSVLPDLATSWSYSNHGRTLTFHLRRGVTWQDGKPFTAADVAFTLNSAASPEYNGGSNSYVAPIAGYAAVEAGKAKSLSGVQIVNRYEIRITLTKPDAAFLSGMTQDILPEHLLKNQPVAKWKSDAFARMPVGTGPFQVTKWVPGQYIEMTRNPHYFGGVPKLEHVIWRFGNQNTMLAAFLDHEVQIAPVPNDDAKLVSTGGNQLVVVKTFDIQYMGMNLADPRLADPKVRQAMAMAIDKRQIVTSLLDGYGAPDNQLFPADSWAYDPAFKGYGYDPKAAAALLTKDGWRMNAQGVRQKGKQTLSFTLIYPTGNLAREESAPLIQQDLANIGIQVQLQSMDFATLVSHLLPTNRKGQIHPPTPANYTLMLLGFGIVNDPDEYMPYFQSTQLPPVGYNYTNYRSAEIDRLFAAEEAATTHAQRVAVFHRISDILGSDVPWVPLYTDENLWAVAPTVHHFDPNPATISGNCVDWSVSG
jgi:peptide/nickel transport system substrate-binding protein